MRKDCITVSLGLPALEVVRVMAETSEQIVVRVRQRARGARCPGYVVVCATLGAV